MVLICRDGTRPIQIKNYHYCMYYIISLQILQHINMYTDEISLDFYESTNLETFITLSKCWSFVSNQLKSEIYITTIDSRQYPEGVRLGWPAHHAPLIFKTNNFLQEWGSFCRHYENSLNLSHYSPRVETSSQITFYLSQGLWVFVRPINLSMPYSKLFVLNQCLLIPS